MTKFRHRFPALVLVAIALIAFAAAPASADSSHATGNSGTSGDPSQPQPRSNADNNGNGANTTGPYDSTRDGSPSGNGNGDGNANGKPCAGCVGKADNKNPPGQQPGPQDNNNGYECDGNNGIAKTNPAHTGCQPGTTPPPPGCTEHCQPPPSCTDHCQPPECTQHCQPTLGCTEHCQPPTECTAAHCQPPTCSEACTQQPPKVIGEVVTPPNGSALVSGELPRTGFNVVDAVAIAVLLLASGALILVGARRPRVSAVPGRASNPAPRGTANHSSTETKEH